MNPSLPFDCWGNEKKKVECKIITFTLKNVFVTETLITSLVWCDFSQKVSKKIIL